MQNKSFEGMTKKQIEERLSNRMILNFCYAILGLIILYVLWRGITNILMVLNMPYIMASLFVLSAAGTVTCYILGSKKNDERITNHAHMLLGITIALFYLNFYFYTQWLPIESTPDFFRPVLKFLKNLDYAYKVTAVAVVISTVIVMVYNAVLLYKYKKMKK